MVVMTFDWLVTEPEDAQIALQAAESMAARFHQDIAIMPDLSVVMLNAATEPPLEIVRYIKESKGIYNG